MKNLCIIISSDYTNSTHSLASTWAREVTTDQATVEATLGATHDMCYISIDPMRKNNREYQKKLIKDFYIELSGRALFEQCHIVLNTHGKAGSNDLSDEIVKSVIAMLSSAHVQITQISMLQCNAAKVNTAVEQRQSDGYLPAHQTVRNKSSSMAILQAKLSHLETTRPQNFALIGFSQAYDPTHDQQLVVQILQGHEIPDENILRVETTEMNVAVRQATMAETLASYKRGLEGEVGGSSEQALNVFSAEIARRKKKIENCISAQESPDRALSPRSFRLFKAVVGETPPNTIQDYNRLHKQWNKANPYKTKKGQPGGKLDIFEAVDDQAKACTGGMF